MESEKRDQQEVRCARRITAEQPALFLKACTDPGLNLPESGIPMERQSPGKHPKCEGPSREHNPLNLIGTNILTEVLVAEFE